MGRIYKRGGRYYVDVMVGGRRVRRSAGTNVVEARKMLVQLERAPEAAYVALDTALAGYLAGLRTRCKRTSVNEADLHRVHLLRHFGSGVNVLELSEAEIDGFVAARLASGVKPATVNGSLRVLRAAVRRAAEVVRVLPPKVRMLKVGRRIPAILSWADVNRLVAGAARPFDLVLLLAALAGLRHQEILHLTVADVDFDAMVLRVTAKAGWSPKSHHERAVPIGTRLAARLAQHAAGLPDTAFAGGYGWLFPGADGGQPLACAHRPVQAAFRAAGLYKPADKPGLHQLRRTWASSLLTNGTSLEALRELGGWADLATVQRYLASTDDEKRRAIAGLEE